jgi:hypothetical protein
MRQSADRAYVARQRLAATAQQAAGIQPAHVAVSESLSRVGNSVRERWRRAVTSPAGNRPGVEVGRTEVVNPGIV